MGVYSRSGPQRRRVARRSVRFTFAAMVAVPVVSLVLIGALAVSAVLGGALAERGFSYHRELVQFAVIIGVGLLVGLASAVLMGSFARQLAREVAALEAAARYLADEQVPQLVARLRNRGQLTAADQASPQLAARTTEIARAAAALASLRQTAVAAATAEAKLRSGIGQVFVSLARRNQSLLQRQLRLIDELEQKASDPAALADLFPLDHLTTRMRRHAESLIVLSGAAPGRSWSAPVPVIDVIRGAVAEVEDYTRVSVLTSSEDAVAGSAVADLIHLLAELIENATLFSPTGMRVEVKAERVANGFAVEIEDRGLGIKPAQLGEINERLATPPDFDLANADQLGLFVVGKLAARHKIQVSLRPSPYGGTSAIVLIPNDIVVSAAELSAGADDRPHDGAPVGLDLPSGEVLALTRRPAPPSLPVGAARQRGRPPEAGYARAPDGAAPGGEQDGGTYRGLPRRVRQASLSPHLRESAAGAPARSAQAGPAPPASAGRTPEQARDLVASLQSGWLRGRRSEPPGAGSGTGAWQAGLGDSEGPQDEEALWKSRGPAFSGRS